MRDLSRARKRSGSNKRRDRRDGRDRKAPKRYVEMSKDDSLRELRSQVPQVFKQVQSLANHSSVNVVNIEEVKDLKSKLENAEEENARLRESLRKRESEIENLQLTISRLNIANLRQRSEIGKLKIQIVKDKKEIENCRNHLEKVFRVDFVGVTDPRSL